MSEKLLRIINHYGILPQLKYFQSEVFELNEAIIRYNEAEYNYFEGYFYVDGDDYELKNHIKEEIADVLVMLLQFKEYYHIEVKDILKIMEEKIERQLKRIEDE